MSDVESASAGQEVFDLRVEHVEKSFGEVRAVRDCSLTVRRGEQVALLGPSGCGKTTLLNIIAGFESCDSGDIWLRGQSLRDIPPSHRNVGMVFQSYALFPHMTVESNIGYGLRIRRMARADIQRSVAEVIDLLKLHGLEERYPSELSGGQQQRVALARTLAVRPVMLLLDEALSALDKNLREQMQVELSILLRRLGITTVLVTHDQREAFTIADRIAVMSGGRILQAGTPEEIYSKPRSPFVLEFVGSANVLQGTTVDTGEQMCVVIGCGLTVPVVGADGFAPNTEVNVYVRAEDIELSSEPTPVHKDAPGRVSLARFLGAVKRHVIDVGGEQIVLDSSASGASARFNVGDTVYIGFLPGHCYILPSDLAAG